MTTLEDWLRGQGKPAGGHYSCSCCHRALDAFALVRDADSDPWTCGNCRTDTARATIATSEAAQVVDRTLWTSPYGLALKADRNRLLDTWRWTIMPDTPLSTGCQAEFVAYLRALQRMTIDAATTDAWHWPAIPALEYPSIVVTASVSVTK